LAYRGYSIEDLVKYASFEEVAMLLRDGELPSSDALADFQKVLHERYEVKRDIRLMMWALPANGHPMDVLQTTIASMATFYPDAGAQDPNSAYTQSALTKIIANMSTLVAMWARISTGYDPIPPSKEMSYAKNFLAMSFGEEPDDDIVKLFDACLILHAEHTINASTFSAMVTASTLANPFASVSAAVGTLAGSLHGGANEDVLNMLDEIGEVKNVRAYIENRLKNKAVIWGPGGGCSGFSYGFTFDDKQPISSSIFKTSSLAPPCKEPAKVPTAADTEANGLASVEKQSFLLIKVKTHFLVSFQVFLNTIRISVILML
jgi:citrate synthase